MVCVISYVGCATGSTGADSAMPLYVLLMFRWIKMHSRLALCFVFTYSSSLQGELGSELHLPIIHLSLLVAILFLTISFPDAEYL